MSTTKAIITRNLLLPFAAGILLTFCPPAGAQYIYYDDFSDYYNGNQNATQCDTGLLLSCCGGELHGWTVAGANAIHAVNLNGVSQYAAMIWDGGTENQITSTGIVANASNVAYKVSFMSGPAVYANCAQATPADHGLLISVLRTDGSTLAAYTNLVGAWAQSETLTNGSFTYVGDGSGPIQIQITGLPGTSGDGFFSGAINDVGVAPVSVTNPPAIVTQPVGGTVLQGSDFTLSVVGNPYALTYQWTLNGAPISGATAPGYTLIDVAPSASGNYTVIVGNPVGSVTSTVATLTVTTASVYATYQAAVLADKPIHYYPLNDTSGTVAADLGSQPVPGTYMGGITLNQPTGEPSLGFSTCALFDGNTGTFVNIGTWDPSTNGFTAEVWVNLDTTASSSSYYDVLGRVNGSTTGAWVLDYVPGYEAQFTAWNSSAAQAPAITPFPARPGQWHYLAGVFDGAAGINTVYVDGVQGPRVTSVGFAGLGSGGQPDMIGASRGGTTAFPGLIAQAAVYNTPLSPAQIRTHFRNAVPAVPPLISRPGVIVSWPNLPPGFMLQTAGSLAGPWADFTGEIETGGNYFMAPLTIGTTNTFFKMSGQAP